MKSIYLDYNSTSPLRPEVMLAMKPYFEDQFGNPSSFHSLGQKARHAIEESRKQIQSLLAKEYGDLIFTSSATEANNLAILGSMANKEAGHLISSAIEHLSVLNPIQKLKKEGFRVTLVNPDQDGIVHSEKIMESVQPNTQLVSLMAANNETGVLQPVHQIGRLLKQKGILFHVDAVQVFGKLEFDFSSLDADLITLSAHKIGGPKGIGALWVRKGIKLEPIIFGGNHENKLRAGTENLPAVVGFSKAAEISFQNLKQESKRLTELRDMLEQGIFLSISGTYLNGSDSQRLPNTSNISFVGADTESILIKLDTEAIHASSGSACTSGSIDPSHVLSAMKLSEDRLHSAIRFSLGFSSSKEEIVWILENLPHWINQLRSL